MNMPANTVKALAPPLVTQTLVPDYYFNEYNSTSDFVHWIKNPTSKDDNYGVFNKMITYYEKR